MKHLVTFLLGISFIIAGLTTTMCEKDNEESEQFKLLTAHPWNFNEIITICQDPEIIGFIDWIADTWPGATVTYRSDGSFALAGADGKDFESGKWKFSNGEREIITFDKDDPSDILGHVRIEALTGEILELTDLADVPASDTCYVKMKWGN